VRTDEYAISPDGGLLAVGFDGGRLVVWDTKTGSIRRGFDGGDSPINTMAISPDARHLVTGHLDGHVDVWDLAHGRRRHRLTDHGKSAVSVFVAPDGCRLFTVSHERACCWDLHTGSRIHAMARPGVVSRTALLNPSWDRLVIGAVGSVLLWDGRSDHPSEILGAGASSGRIRAVDVVTTPSGPVVVAANEMSGVHVIDLVVATS
jgi:WD40 repeat protein